MREDTNDIIRYRNNQMTEKERNAFEKRALNDPFLSEALEGAESIDAEMYSADVKDLSAQLQRTGVANWTMALRIAAGIIIVVTAGWMIFRNNSVEPERLAGIQEKDSTATPARDTSTQLLSLAKPKSEASQPAETTKATASKKEKPVVDTATVATTTDDVSESGLGISSQPTTAATSPATGPAQTDVTLPVHELKEEEAAQRAEVAESPTRMKQAAPMAAQDAALEKKSGDASPRRSEVIVLPPGEVVGKTTPAVPSGGMSSYQEYLERNQQMPREAEAAGVNGKVTIAFSILPDGTLSDFVTVKGLGFGCDEEVIRLIRNGPAWTPSINSGKRLTTAITVTLTFPPKE